MKDILINYENKFSIHYVFLVALCFTTLINIAGTENFVSTEIQKSIFILIASLAWLSLFLFNNIKIKKLNPTTIFLFLTMIVVLLSAINSDYREKSIREATFLVVLLSLPILLSFSKNIRNFLFYMIIVTSVVSTLFCVLENFGVKVIDFSQESSEQKSGVFENRNILGGYLMISIFITLKILSGKKNICSRIILSGILIFEFIGLGFSNTRLAWLGCLFGVIMLFIFVIKNKLDRFFSWMLVCVIFFSSIMLFVFNLIKPKPIDYPGRISQIFDFETRSVKARLILANISFEMIKEEPLIGSGPGTFEICSDKFMAKVIQNEEFRYIYKIPDYSHNIFLDIFTECGIIGGLAFFIFLIFLFSSSLKNLFSNKDIESAITFCCFIAFIIYSLGHSSFRFAPIVFSFFLLSNFFKEDNLLIKRKFFSTSLVVVPVIIVFGILHLKNLIGNYYLFEAIKSDEKQDYEVALRKYKKATGFIGDNYHAYKQIGHMYVQKGEWVESLKYFHKALKYHPYRESVFVEIGEIYKRCELLDLAVKYFEKAVEIRPNYERAYSNLIRILKEMDRKADALNWCEKGLEMIPDSENLKRLRKNLQTQ